jgi:hypothetical protein
MKKCTVHIISNIIFFGLWTVNYIKYEILIKYIYKVFYHLLPTKLNSNSKYILCISVLLEDGYKKEPKHVGVVSYIYIYIYIDE